VIRMRRSSRLGLAAASVLLAGCATLPPGEGSKRACLDRRDVNSIKPLDDRHALVRRGSGRYSLFTMDKACHGLKLSRSIVIEGSAGRVCGDGVTLIAFEYPSLGPMRCRIELIEPVADENAARELILSRAGPE
jgi:hypothetical protein